MSRKSKSPTPEPKPVEESPSEGSVSNAQAVRDAMSAGCEKIDDIDAYVRENYGKDIPRQQISAYKSQTLKKSGQVPGKRGRRPKAAVEGYLAPPVVPKGDGDLIDALRALKPLVAKVGVDKVKELAELLS